MQYLSQLHAAESFIEFLWFIVYLLMFFLFFLIAYAIFCNIVILH